MTNFSKIILTVIIAMTATISFGCSSTDTDKAETTTQMITEQTTAEETYPTDNTTATIEAIEGKKADTDDVIKILNDNGYPESFMRKKYEFDEKQLNSENNKNYVIDRMSNSIDYFTTLQASYTKRENMKVTWITYNIDRRAKKAKELTYLFNRNDNSWIPSSYLVVDGNYHLGYTFDENSKKKYTFKSTSQTPDFKTVYDVTNLIKTSLSKELKCKTNEIRENLYKYDETDVIYYVDVPTLLLYFYDNLYIGLYTQRRNNPISLTNSADHYLPDLFVIESLYNYSDWKIDELKKDGDTEIICISGKCFDRIYEWENSFKLGIDKNTGVIISKQIINGSGNVIEEWNNVHYLVDREIDETIFEPLEITTE